MNLDLSSAVWRKSVRSQQGPDCVEVAGLGGVIAIRDAKNPGGPALIFGRTEMADLFGRVRSGALNL